MSDAFVPAVQDGNDADARAKMSLAATLAGMGFGNAGVHIPHANAYPIAGRVRDYRPPDYPQAEPLIPHGMAVVAHRTGGVPGHVRGLPGPARARRAVAGRRRRRPGCPARRSAEHHGRRGDPVGARRGGLLRR